MATASVPWSSLAAASEYSSKLLHRRTCVQGVAVSCSIFPRRIFPPALAETRAFSRRTDFYCPTRFRDRQDTKCPGKVRVLVVMDDADTAQGTEEPLQDVSNNMRV